MEQVHQLLDIIEERKKAGVTGLGVVLSFVNRRVHPIKERVNLGYEFSGVGDPTRESDVAWTPGALVDRLKPLFTSDVILNNDGCLRPYSLDKPTDEVPARILMSSVACLFSK